MDIIVKANAKVNLFLKITGTDERGYHLLKMFNSSVDIFDSVSVEVTDGEGIEVVFENAPFLEAKSNTAFKAAEEFKKNFPALCFGKKISVSVKKGIPVGAGLGGSSADAAAVLYCLARLFDVDVSRVFSFAARIGSDVPYMLLGGNAVVEGIGEKITPKPFKSFQLTVAKPFGSVSSAECYKAFDNLSEAEKEKNVCFGNSVFKRDFGFETFNSLALPAADLNCGVEYLLDFFKNEGADAYFVTGSGSAVCAYFEDPLKGMVALKKLESDENVEFVKNVVSLEKGIQVQAVNL